MPFEFSFYFGFTAFSLCISDFNGYFGCVNSLNIFLKIFNVEINADIWRQCNLATVICNIYCLR